MKNYDTAVIGGGPAGRACAEKLAAAGVRTALVEKSAPGGRAVNSGYFISKVLISAGERYGAEAPHHLQDLVAGRKKRAQSSWRSDLEEAGVKIYRGEASIPAAGRVEIAGEDELELEVENIVLATGSRPVSPLAFSRAESQRIITYEEVMAGNWLEVESVAIVGADVEGTEFASLYDRLGAGVTMIEQKERILPNTDGEIAKFMRENYDERGIEIETSNTVEDFEKREDKLLLELEGGHIETEVLILTGAQKPVLPDLGADLELDFDEEGFISRDSRMQTSQPGILAAGDVVGGMSSASAAMSEGRVAAGTILGEKTEIDYLHIPYVFFSTPRVTGIGLREEDVRGEDRFAALSLTFAHNLRALAAGEEEGLARLIIDEMEGTVVGAHLAGEGLEEVHGLLAAAVQEEIQLQRLAEMPLAQSHTFGDNKKNLPPLWRQRSLMR
ncbi:dihydrolipoyl dehydrogenase family protein [Halarsenatibacter silvermanii]|uniref:Dihydrolipoamide dehydrogenase n=1 Tax=Halarsenatibacter silvermanii TaxID=321763 RepID=A0A1G9KSL2_9FIRM|nr:NAD(P)/FAD-dependent oxidoreductase [Halarsenatibacter silvermanii]SDL52649.1 dihydrolipoamide dehydrogenase [Halarsenatibacter silvermanii]